MKKLGQKLKVYKWVVYPKSSPNWGDEYQKPVKPTFTNLTKASAIEYKGREFWGVKTGTAYGDFIKANPNFKTAKPKVSLQPKRQKTSSLFGFKPKRYKKSTSFFGLKF
jgi:hypothetical protein